MAGYSHTNLNQSRVLAALARVTTHFSIQSMSVDAARSAARQIRLNWDDYGKSELRRIR